MPTPPLLKRAAKKDNGKHGRKAEKSLASRLGGTLTPGSGALQGAKGDVSVGEFLLENKSTSGESFSMKQAWLHKIYQEALECGKNPALAFAFVNQQGRSEKCDRWVAVPEHIWQELMDGGE